MMDTPSKISFIWMNPVISKKDFYLKIKNALTAINYLQ